MPRETRDFSFGFLQLPVGHRVSRFKSLSSVTLPPFRGIVTLLPLLGFLPGAIHFLVSAILDSPDVRRDTLSLLVGGGETSMAFRLKRFDFAGLTIDQCLQSIPLLDQVLPQGVAVAELAVQVGTGMFGQLLARPGLGHRGLGLGQGGRPVRAFLVETGLARRKGGPVFGQPGLEEAFRVRHGQLPERGHRLPRFRREFRELQDVLEALRQATAPRVQHPRDRVR
ncbi:hypothetical protein ASG87_05575 [Frateuria sp. Soil773]|nr:hypothetical protein ASG87_05575 [Frateuria sp. Soil773]